MIFVDTSGFFALFVSADQKHLEASEWYQANDNRLVTTDYVIDELLTLMRARGAAAKAIQVGRLLVEQRISGLERVNPEDFFRAWNIFSRYTDKEWSFTDCVSRVVMERLAITTAFAFDEHFRQFGTVRVVP